MWTQEVQLWINNSAYATIEIYYSHTFFKGIVSIDVVVQINIDKVVQYTIKSNFRSDTCESKDL